MNLLNRKNNVSTFEVLIIIIGFLWVVFFLSFFLPINQYGIVPRSTAGLIGILLSPFLHYNFIHLLTNSITLFILSSFLAGLEGKHSISVVFHILIWGGIGTWVIGRPHSIHIGASGVIYGIMGYLFSIGIFKRSLKTIIVSLIVFFIFGGAISGIIPGSPIISWEGHLSGFLAGIMIAWIYSKKN